MISDWLDYGWLVLAAFYLVIYFYQRRRKYLVFIQNGALRIQGPFGKKINLNEVQQIRKFAGDYILKTKVNLLTINTQIIDKASLSELNRELQKFDVEWQKLFC